MKLYKKINFILRLLIVFSMTIINIPIKNLEAAQNEILYAYTLECVEHKNYAVENLGKYIISNGYVGNLDEYKLGQGIYINDSLDYEKVLFPIWRNGNIVSVFLVINYEGEYSGVYSTSYTSQLDILQGIASNESPLYLVVERDTLFAVVENYWYDLNGNPGTYILGNRYNNSELTSKEITEFIEFNIPIQSRIPTTYRKSFSIYYQQTGAYCYSYALGNLLRNMGYTSYTPTNIQEYMEYESGATNAEMASYLSSKGLSCSYANTGYLQFVDVNNIIYNLNSYIYIGATNQVNLTTGHAFVIFGYFNDGTTKLYNVWNPWYTSVQTMDATSRIITTQDTRTYKWDRGYIYDIE